MMKRAIMGVVCASALIGVGVGSCDDEDALVGDTATYDSYLYYGYYPADVYYSGYYWTDPYYYYYAAYGGGGTSTGAAGSTGVAGSTGAAGAGGGGGGMMPTTIGRTSDMTVGDVLRALARGEMVCGDNQVSITPKMGPDACATDGTGMSRTGVNIFFNGCMLTSGSRIDGTFDVEGTRTLSDPACGPGTTVTVTATTMVTYLARTTPSGVKIVMPNSNGTITTSYIAGQMPSSVAVTMSGTLQLVGPGGVTSADRSFSGDISMMPSSDRMSYTTDGMITLQDTADSTSTTLTAQGLNRSAACCRPTGGTLTIDRTTGSSSGTHTWTFGPSCGAMMFDGASISAPACL